MTPDSELHFQTLVQALEHQVHTNPNKLAYRYLTDGETESHRLTYAELHRDARQVALRLLEVARPGDRALLLYPQGLEFVTALFGCFLAGIIAVPVYPPVGKRRTERLENVAADCTPKLAVTLEAMGREAQQWFAEKGLPSHLNWLYTDTLDKTSLPDGKVNAGQLPEITPETVALLQYTSGSTGDPKGVEVTHDNLVHNNHELLKAVNFNTEVVSWLPIYHDMGLIGNLIFVVYCGGTLTMMSPVDFVRRPVRWLKALSDYKATGTGAPNFAYDLCCRYISDKDLEGIDLSHWDATCNGAEPIKPDTLRRFTERFGKVGFREEVFVPCYGMAEATALVAGNRGAIHHLHLDLAAMQQGNVAIAAANAHEKNVKELACSGPPAAGMRIAIVDPKTLQRCAPDTIGEIWVQGRSVTKGYWNKPELNKSMFEASIQKPDGTPLSEEGKWLRTGDMGFMRNGMLYVSGRLKEMLIINGANIFPQDIERVIQENNPVIEENAGAVFGVEGDAGSEQIIVFQEIARKHVNNFNPAAVITAISQRVLTHSELSVSGVYLISPGRLPKTTSGKIQRYKCAEAYAAKDIPGLLAHWDINELKTKNQNTMPDNTLQPIKSHDAPLFATIAEALSHYSDSEGDRVAYRFLTDGETEGATLSFPELLRKGHSIAAEILKVAKPGDRAILLYPPGVEFVEAFVGCLLAGVISVPMYPPSGHRRLGRLELVAGDCAPVVALSITEVTAQAKAWFSEKEVLRSIQWINTNEVKQAVPSAMPVVNPGDIAFLQYTSGSTGTPKGVEVTHANLVHNAFLISNSLGGLRKMAGWLPIYHDMGLIGNIVYNMYCGGELNFMSPIDFIRKPARWLQAISKYGAQANASPNFAYDLCVKGISDEEMEGVDLSTWRASCNGAEPIKPNTIRRFLKRFAKYGLREDMMLPCYGMAETTLIVSGRIGEIHNLKIDKDAFLDRKIVPVDQHLPESPRVLEIASSGPVLPETLVEIVDPVTMQKCAPNTIGEVWIQGKSVTNGYWKRPELTEATFRATLRNGEGKPIEAAGNFLRTGDMGFIHNGMLYVSGRIKEMIIISGANHYPQDIEKTVQEGLSEVQENSGAAFGVEDAEGNERLVVFQEITRESARDFDAEAIFDKIRNKIFASHEVPVSAIYLMGPGQIPKTTSGKIQRVFCKRMFESGEVPGALSTWQSPEFKTQADAPERESVPVAPNMAEGQRFVNLVSALKYHATHQPDQLAFQYLDDGEAEGRRLTFAQLHTAAQTKAFNLLEMAKPGDRVLILLPSGLDFIVAYFGCLMAGLVAVPLYPPTGKRRLSRFANVSADCKPALIISSADVAEKAQDWFAELDELKHVPWYVVGLMRKSTPKLLAEINPLSTAFMQYTSGSTGASKGVEVTHLNLAHNCYIIESAVEGANTMVSWLPIYHDMGLIGKILYNVYIGGTCYLMAPVDFIRKPLRWLQAISHYQATLSAAPNFAYELCVSQISDKEMEGLDLSSWRFASNGSETVKAGTIHRFVEKFSRFGFPKDAMLPCYGLAEATLMVTGKAHTAAELSVDTDALLQGKIAASTDKAKARTLVASGSPIKDMVVSIVNPETMKVCPPDEVGEIWIQGASVAKGYYGKEELTREFFKAQIRDNQGNVLAEKGHYLRTGDLGFEHDGMVYVTGRIKEMLIINGANIYPQDIEDTLQASHEALEIHGGAVFAVERDDNTKVIVFQEVKRTHVSTYAAADLYEAITTSVQQEHELSIGAIYLISPGRLPRTTSGKIQRLQCQKQYEDNIPENILDFWDLDHQVEKTPEKKAPVAKNSGLRQKEVEAKIIEEISSALELSPASIDVTASFSRLGISSIQGIQLTDRLSQYLGVKVQPTDLYDYSTISDLSAYITGLSSSGAQAETAVAEVRTSEIANEPVAVIGMSCRLPGAENLDSYWQLLSGGKDAITEVPADRWNLQDFYAEKQEPGKMVTKWGGFLNGVDLFDAPFFEISPREAEVMDPQQRVLLQETYKLLESSGYPAESLRGKNVGVFIGIAGSDYAGMVLNEVTDRNIYTATGTSYSIVANRLSYFFDFSGPSVALDTACSSSLVALHLAAQAIRNGECSTAIAGGVNMILAPDGTLSFSESGLMAHDGHCKTFGAEANGIVRSDGCGVVLLKPLSQALADGDHIHAVIRGSAVNQDGRSNGLTAPNGLAQQECLRAALRNAHLAPADVAFVECHGTGTILGDPIEVNALNAVYGKGRKSPLVVGSVKANIGHLEAAAGVAGFIKAALALSHRQVPPQIHFDAPNPQIDWKNVNVQVAKGGHIYNGEPQVLRAGVSSFGFGGTNAHIILEEAPKASMAKASLPDRGYHVVPVSGKDARALKQRLADLDRFLEQRPDTVLADLAYTLSTSRDHFKQRAVVFGSDVASVRKGLAAAARGEESLQGFSGIRREGHEKIAFLFTGAGPQYPGMGKYMYDQEPAFRAALDAAVAYANKHLSLDLMKVIFCTPGSAEHGLLDRIDFMQPAVFAYEYAMYKWWESLGVTPDIVIGHSLGELVAACVAGVFDLESAMKLTVKRGDLIYRMPVPGTMASIQGSEAEVIAAIGTRTKVSVGVLNNPMQTVVSGEVADVEAIVAHFTAMGRKTKVLNISRAGHSPLMDPISDAFREVAASFAMQPASIPVVSNVTGKVAGDEIATAQYWVDHLRQPVRFYDGLNTLDQAGANVLIEVGPNPVLLGISTQAGLPKGAIHIASANEEDPNNTVLYNALAKYYASGGKIDWKAWFAERPAALTAAPNYPFSATRHWIETGKKKSTAGAPTGQPLLSQALKVAGLEGVFELEVSWDLIPYLRHHQIIDTLIAPGSFHIELILEYMAYAKKDYTLRELSIQRPLYVDQHMPRRVQLVVEKQELSDGLNVKIFSADNTGGDWTLHVSGTLQRRKKGAAEEAVDLEVLKQEFPKALDVQKFYNDLAEIGFHYGHSFQGVQELYSGNRASMGRVAVQLDGDELVQAPKNQLHPTLLDSAFQLLMAVSDDEGEKETYLPFAVENLNLLLPNLTEYWAVLRARDTAPGAEIMSCDITLYGPEGQYAGALGFTCKKASPEQIVAGGSRLRSDWMFDIRWSDLNANALAEKLPTQLLVVQPAGMAGGYSAFTSGLNERKVAHRTCSNWNEAKTLLDGGSYDAMAVLWDTSTGGRSVADKAREVAYEGLQMLKDTIAMAQGKGGDFIKRIFFVTEGFASGQINPASAPVWGLGRTFAKETNFDVKLIDTDGSSGSISQLHTVMFGAGAENQLRISGGKIQVLRLEKHRSPGGDPRVLTAQATYLITGGLGDLGLQAARWMAKNTEVAHLLLWARRAPGDEAKAAIAELEAAGVKITVQSVDVIDAAAVKKAIDSVPAEYPLKGVLHIAGVADDALIPEQSREKFDKVIMPKIQGTWNLHEATKHLDLEVFSLYSSLSAIAGVPGVANYAVGNAFLDTLAAFRRSQGLAAHSINWGAWATSTGLLDASRVEDFRNYMRARGLGLIEGEAGLDILGYTLRSAKLDSQTLVAPLLLNSRAPFENAIGDVQPLYQELFAREEEEEAGDDDSKESIALRLSRLETHQERKKLLVFELQKQVGLVIRRDDVEAIDPDAEFFALGADSLMLAELVNRISKLVRVPLSPTVVFDQRCINDLAEDLLTNTIKWDAASVAGEVGKASKPKPAVKVDAQVVANAVVEEVPVMENGHLDDWFDVLKANLEREIMKRGKDPKALQDISALRRTVSKLAALLDRKL